MYLKLPLLFLNKSRAIASNTPNDWITRQTLLERASDPEDSQAWEDFVHYYDRFIKVVIHKLSNSNTAEVDDLCQEVVLKLWKNLKTYDPEKSKFRTWMSTIIRNTIYSYFESKQRTNKKHDNFAEEQLRQMDESNDVEKMIEEEWKNHISLLAMDKVRECFSKNAMKIFEMSLEGMSVEEIAKELNLKEDSIYVMKSRVKKQFMEEIRQLVKALES